MIPTDRLPGPRPWRPGRLGRQIVAVAIAVVVALVGYGIYTNGGLFGGGGRAGAPTLTIYTYPSLFGGNCGGTPQFNETFGGFEAKYHVSIQVVCPTISLVGALLAQRGSPGADLVIGLDELTAPVAQADGLLIPYEPPAAAFINGTLAAELSPTWGVVPYEWGYLGIDYNTTFNSAQGGSIAHLSLDSIAQNRTLASNFLYENPTTSITGEEFLAWEVLYYQDVLHQPWESFWNATLGVAPTSPDWGDAFSAFVAGPGAPGMVVSYTTDPACAAFAPSYCGAPGSYNSTVSWFHGVPYGWRTVYEIGIVAGSTHPTLAEECENWFLGPTVQSLIPTSEWMYPANSTVALPSVYDAAPNPASFVPLNDALAPSSLAQAMLGWLDTWQSLS